LSGQRGEPVYGSVAFGVNLRQIDTGIRDSTFSLTQLDLGVESCLNPPLCDRKYLQPLLFGTLVNVSKCIGSIELEV
jgi:hypothetical protein